MEKLPMCRICLAENVRMYVVANRNLQELYEKLTDIPFVTDDRRLMLACFFCCTKLKQCYQLLRQCLAAEKLFTQMMNEDYEPKPIINQDHFEFLKPTQKLITSPIEHTSINDECQTESIAIKEELPAVFEGLDDIIEPKEEHQSYELELENSVYNYLDTADRPACNSESDLEDDKPLMEFKIEVEQEEVSNKKRRASETKKPRQSSKTRLWPSIPRRKHAKKNKRQLSSRDSSVPPRHFEGIQTESNRNNTNDQELPSRSSSRGPGGIVITTTDEINAPPSFEVFFDLESNQPMNVEPIGQSFSRNITPTSSTTGGYSECRRNK